jgi:hypothetical protein
MADEGINQQPMSRRELEEKIVARAWTDDDFRQKFVADPKGQFEAHLGTKLPEPLKITVHEETPDSLHFVIPVKPKGDLAELSDEDLEKVAGGVDVLGTALIVTLVVQSALGSALTQLATNRYGGWNK